MEIKENSIIVYRDDNAITMSIVKEIKGKELYCDSSICSLDGGKSFMQTKKIYNKYEGEILSDCITLIDTEEFDMMLDTNLIDKSKLTNVK